MAESENITRCPHCQTSFRVLEAQLSAANGAVRCGSCLQVFVARDYFLNVDKEVITEAAAAPGDRVAPGEAAAPGEEVATDQDEVSNIKSGAPMVPAAHAYHGLEQPEKSPADRAEDVTPAVNDLGGLANDADVSIPSEDETDLAKLDLVELDLVELGLVKLDRVKLDLVEEDLRDMVGEVPASRPQQWPWVIAGFVLLVLLGGQYAWYGKDVLAQDATVRPYYTLVCGYLGCGLPVYRNRRAIEATDLLVRSRQNNPPVLIVDAIIKNSAAFQQVFPDLELQFTNAENQIIASRRFRPTDYLAGEMIGLRYFPAYTEVRLSLEIVDPGDKALGYSMAIMPDS
jgi:predicted Zn finger-like uncharacterized protein